jgi:hypothetical protein
LWLEMVHAYHVTLTKNLMELEEVAFQGSVVVALSFCLMESASLAQLQRRQPQMEEVVFPLIVARETG